MSSEQTTETFYIVPMFPYPSGKLHMGHVRNYAISDAIARHHRRQGRRVLHPIGWDAFGLPAENAAREEGADPRQWTDERIIAMRAQLDRLEFEFTPGHEIATHRPDYIALGQSLFLRFYRAGLIERRTGEVWWDPQDQTVLANEQVIDGRGWRSGAPVERKTLSMLFAQVRAHSGDLASGLDQVDWPSQAIAAQRAWIGHDPEAPDQPRLRDWCLSRQRSWGTPVPLVNCTDCGECAVPESWLPLANLPTQPGADDLACACPQCGKPAQRSAETLDTFWDSAFYTLVYPDSRQDKAVIVAGPAFRSFGGVDLYVGGLEHATMHLLYARWFARALRQVGFDVPVEPFSHLIGQGMVCAPAYQDAADRWVNPATIRFANGAPVDAQGEPVRSVGVVKMSKSKKNGVDPDQLVAAFGAEATRWAMLFAAPHAADVDWTSNIVQVARRHLDRMQEQAVVLATVPAGTTDSRLEQEAARLRQVAVHSFESKDGFNAMMGTALGLWRSVVRAGQGGHGDSARVAAAAVADALWAIVPRAMEGVMTTIDPSWAPRPICPQAVSVDRPLVVQVGGVRKIVIPNGALDQQQALDWLRANQPEFFRDYLSEPDVSLVFVPGKILNIMRKPTMRPRVR